MNLSQEIRLSFVLMCLLLTVGTCALFISANTSTGSSVTFTGTVATSTLQGGPPDIYPQVPGSTNPAIYQGNIQTTICVPGFTGRPGYRPTSNYTTALKIAQLKSYGNKDQKTADYEEDHLISLELGGNPTDSNNLWPEPYTASIPDGGAKTKDKVENYLHAQVCSGNMPLVQAQVLISTDWYAVYVKNLKGKYGSIQDDSDPDDE